MTVLLTVKVCGKQRTFETPSFLPVFKRMTTPATPTRPVLGHTWSASMASLGPSTPTRLSSTVAGAAGRGNPLSLRLYKILGARYEDESTREALEILSGMYAPAAAAAVEQPSSSAAPPGAGAGGNKVATPRRSGKVVGDGDGGAEAGAQSDESEDGTVVSASVPRTGIVKPAAPTTPTTTDATSGNDSAARARKNLKRDVEMKMARSSRLFLSAFREVDKVGLMVSRYLFLED